MTQDVKNLGDAGLQGIQLPASIYVGKNVVRRHVLEFYKLAATHKLLTQDAQVLAVFDCVVLEQHGGRLGSFTLHDYAVLTTTNLITWGRGQNRDLVDTFEWSEVVLEKFGRRSPIEGMIKVSNQTRSAVSKRRIAIRTKNENANEPVAQAEENGKQNGIALYLDLMPFEDVRTCANMIYFLNNKGGETPGIDAFNAKFKVELAESTERLTTIANAMKSFYVQQANGVWIEKGYTEEAEMLEKVSARAGRKEESNKNKDSKLRRGYTSPYKLGKGSVAAQAPKPVSTPKVAASPKTTTGSKSTSSADESWFYSDFSKLDRTENKKPVAQAKNTKAPAPKPAPTPRAAAPVRSPKPVVKPTPAPKVAKAIEEKSASSENERTVAIPFGASLGALNLFTCSRILRGLWLDPRTLGLRISSISNNSALLMDLFGTVATDAEARQKAINRLRVNIDNGPIAKNAILHYTIYPFLKPVLDAVASPEIDRVIHKIKVRATEKVVAPETSVKKPVESKPIVTTAKAPVEPPKPAAPAPTVEAPKPAAPAPTVAVSKPVEAPKPAAPAPTVAVSKPVEAPKPAAPAPVVAASKPVEAPKPAAPAPVVEAAKKAMETKSPEAVAKPTEKPKVEDKLPVQQPPKPIAATPIEGTDATTKINISAPKVTDPTASLGKEDEKPPEPSKLDKI